MSGADRISKNRRKSKKIRKTKVRCDSHHVYPRSRKKKGDLGKFKAILGPLRLHGEIQTHRAWHHLFGWLFPEEVVVLLKTATRLGLNTASEIIYFIKCSLQPRRAFAFATNDDLAAWRKIFGEQTSFRSLRKIIMRNWFYPGVKAIIVGKKVVKVTIFIPKISQNDRLINNINRCENIHINSFKDGRLLEIS